MSDPVTKLLTEAGAKTFTPAEKLRFRAMGSELAECYQTLGDFDPGKLAQQLEAAHAGVAPSGEKLDGLDARLAAVASIQRSIAESAARIADARERERALFGEAKSPASRLLTAAIAQADGLLASPPALPVPPILSTWGIDLDLVSQFTAVIAGARQTLCEAAQDDYSRRGSHEVGFNHLTRAQLTK
jgi:hypothetical protein